MRGLLEAVLFSLIAILAIATAAEARTYIVQSGDTPGEIAGKFAPALSELREANPGVNFSVLQPGARIVDPRPEPAELKRLEAEVTRLKGELAQVTGERDARTRELAVTETRNSMLNAKVAELEPLALQAESYRDRFRGWVGMLLAMLSITVILIVLHWRIRRSLDRRILDLQQEVARARNEGVMSAAAPRSAGASAPRRANGADTTAKEASPH